MAVINTNIFSLIAQRNLMSTQSSLQTSITRLSSGLRINSAADDAAGLAISNRMTSQLNGLDQAERNANDGISLAQTAQGALQGITDNLQRVRQLAVQSANATNSASDRAALDQEVQQRLAEIDRVASTTSFNGLHILDGTFGAANFQVGANSGETINVNLSSGVRSTQIGQIASTTSGAVSTAATTGTLTVQVGSGTAVTVGASSLYAGTATGQTGDSAFAKAAAINASGIGGLTVTASTTQSYAAAPASIGGAAGNTYGLTINGQTIYAAGTSVSTALTIGSVVSQINSYSSSTGVTATLNGTNLTLTAADGRNVAVTETFGGGTAAGISGGAAVATTYQGNLTMTASQSIQVSNEGLALGLAANNTTIGVDTKTLTSVKVDTIANANTAISRIDSAINSVNTLAGTLGAIQNRFQSSISNLESVKQNLSAARSRITDADFASETANLTRAQVLQQAGTAMLAQANALPQSVLKLLG